MKLSNLFIVNAIYAIIIGLAFVLVPDRAAAQYGADLSEAGLFAARLLGASTLGYAVLAWLIRNAGDSEARQAVVLAMFVGSAVGFIVALMGQLTYDWLAPLGWITVLGYLILGAGYGYFYFVKPGGS